MERYRQGSAHGRFQPLHRGHLEYLRAAKDRCDFLWVGVTQPDIECLGVSPSNPHRHEPENNPLAYEERVEMITGVLLDEGIAPDEFGVIRFPIDTPERLLASLPVTVPVFTTVCDEWNRLKINLLTRMGYQVVILFERAEKAHDGVMIRHLIRDGDKRWRDLVPRAAAEAVDKYDVRRRLIQAVTMRGDGRSQM